MKEQEHTQGERLGEAKGSRLGGGEWIQGSVKLWEQGEGRGAW